MSYIKPYVNISNPYKSNFDDVNISRTIYYGEVVNINDDTSGGRIKVRIDGLDNNKTNENLPWSYPLLPKYYHLIPQVGEIVRIFIEDIKYPNRSRFWMGSVISQHQKIGYDSIYTALSTTNVGLTNPEPSIVTYPEAKYVFPDNEDIGIIGRVNADLILKKNQIIIRAGKHDNDNVYKLNIKNPAQIQLNFEQKTNENSFTSNIILNADKIALITHKGNPQFKSGYLTDEDRLNIFNESHPIARADVLVKIMDVFRKAIINHIHGYSNSVADKNAIINELEKINLSDIVQNNILIN